MWCLNDVVYVCLYAMRRRSLLVPLKDWCLIPAFVAATTSESAAAAVEHYLVPPSLADMVVDYSRTSIMSAALRHCFGRVGVPELSPAAPPPLDGGTSRKAQQLLHGGHAAASWSLARCLVSSLEQPVAVLRALQFALVDKVPEDLLSNYRL